MTLCEWCGHQIEPEELTHINEWPFHKSCIKTMAALQKSGIKEALSGNNICPRCLARDHLKIELRAEEREAIPMHFWIKKCPRCGWTPLDENWKYTRQPFKFLFTPHVIIRRRNWVYQDTVFDFLIYIGMTWLVWFYIFPQLLAQIGVA